MSFDDETIKGKLEDLDNDETIDVTSQEADFIEQLLHKWEHSFTAAQTNYALHILEKYGII